MSTVFRIFVGLPSYNEADSISKVTADIDAALRTLPFAYDATIVNADNSSTDGTAAVFLATPTASSKAVLTTGHQAGKGANWRALLDAACEADADAVLFVDTDLAEVPASWVQGLLGAVYDGADFSFPLRPPTWNGGDLTYQLAYPLLAAAFGVDLREPLCGDIALSARAARRLCSLDWSAAELRFGVDFLVASVAAGSHWQTVPLQDRRRNKLRSFSATPSEDYRMGAKFAEVSEAIAGRVLRRLSGPPPQGLAGVDLHPHAVPRVTVPLQDPDIDRLAAATARRLRLDAESGALDAFPRSLARQLAEHATSSAAVTGLPWHVWRQCLFSWVASWRPGEQRIATDLVETLFLNRVVGHHSEIAGTTDWYASVRQQAHDMFTHRLQMWSWP